MTDEEKKEHESEYESLLALYIALLRSLNSDKERESLFELCRKRVDFAFRHVIKGLDVDYDYAIILLQNMEDESISQQDKDLRDRLEAAINNLIDFGVCEEYQLYEETLDIIGIDGVVDFNSEEYRELLGLCEKYNDRYAAVENGDIAYAGVMAARWMRMSPNDYVVYWTQNDSRVRPWHLALQGYAAPVDEFPSWMIPPIEYHCRCFLELLETGSVNGKIADIKNAVRKISKPKELDGVYEESLAKCGRIFGPSHSYFSIEDKDKDMLNEFVSRLKTEYYGI